ncbi:MAG: hypothetical protein L3K17_03880 [Thermoplasmata archaeon]|nr:hypothetical protein [Thermoplasmata archaeon]
MAKWFSRAPDTPPEIVERVEPVEIPVITETKRRLGRDEYDAALAGAFRQVIDDLQRAYGLTFPAGWSQYEILDKGLAEPKLGHLPEFIRRLTDLYIPMRFGPPPWARDPDQLSGLLRSIYAQRPMWALYIESKREGPRASPRAAPSVAAAASKGSREAA